MAGQTIRMRSAHAAELEFPDQQPGHDRLAGAGVVGQQEADAGELREIVVDGFELVRQRVDAGDGQAEVGIELVGDAERIGLDAEAQQVPSPSKARSRIGC